MPITSVTSTAVSQTCILCGAAYVHDVVDLVLGTTHCDGAVVFPVCTCGGQETVIRDLGPSVGESHPHRLAVNALTELLKGLGQTAPAHDYSNETGPVEVATLPFEV